MSTHWFTLRLEGPSAMSETFSEALYEDGHDCVWGASEGMVTVAYRREAPSLREAILSAIASVHRADRSVRIVGLDLDEGTIDDAFAA